MLAAYTGPASRIENVQTVDIAEERDCREAFVERIVWLCRNGFCVALGKLVIRFTSDRLRRLIHIGHGLALVSSEELQQFVNDLNADVEWLIMARPLPSRRSAAPDPLLPAVLRRMSVNSVNRTVIQISQVRSVFTDTGQYWAIRQSHVGPVARLSTRDAA
jgi:predicted RNA-binding protein with PIN domain